MNNNYTLQIKNVTSTTADVDIYSATAPSTTAFQSGQIGFFKQSDPSSVFFNSFTDPGTPNGQKVATVYLTGLSPDTEYIVHVQIPFIGTYYPFTTKISPDTPRVATQGQWEDLASRIKNLSYSTSEVDTGGTWIDGSPIYKKTIDTGTLPNNTMKIVQHGVGVSLKRAIKIEGYAYSPNLGINMSIPDNEIKVQVAGVDIEIYTSADLSMFTESYVTLYYTKTQ